jgi:hypothetical protein
MDKVKLEKNKVHQKYLLSDGREVVGTTTALGIMAKPALVAWAWKLGQQGIDYRKVKDQAADIGTLAHFLCECYLKKQEPDTSDFSPNDLAKAENAYIKFTSWWDSNGFELVASEAQLVSVKHEFGGTIDIVAKDKNGILHLIDLKTSKGVWDEYWYQVAAYRELWNNNHEEIDRITGTTYIVRIGKETEGDFETPDRPDLTDELDAFLKCLALYKSNQKCKSKNKQRKG